MASAIRTPKAAKAKVRRNRRKFAETGDQFVLGLPKDKALKTSDITKAWAVPVAGEAAHVRPGTAVFYTCL